MIKYFIILVLLLIIYPSQAQQIYLEGGKTISSINFKNSEGQKLSNLYPINTSYFSTGIKDKLFTKRLHYILGIGYTGYGAIGSDPYSSSFMKWEANYLELNLGGDVEIFKFNKVLLYYNLTSSYSLFIQGTQILNNKIINLKTTDDFNGLIIHFRTGLGISYPITDYMSIYSQYLLGSSLSKKSETNVSSLGTEKTRFVSNNIGFGLLFNINN